MRGKHTHRLKSNPLERVASNQWNEHNRNGKLLEYIMGDGAKPATDVSDRDQLVAATVMQWLGSPVGLAYVDEFIVKRRAMEAAGWSNLLQRKQDYPE